MSIRRAVALQPLPNLAWQGATGYSEFPSLGIARLSNDVASFGITVTAGHPRTTEDIEEALTDGADIVILGDFRYYAYFANPRFQVCAALRELRNIGWDGPVVVAGRHAKHMSFLKLDGTAVAESYRDLMTLLTGLDARDHQLGLDGDALPGPGIPDMNVLADGADLPGSFSRPGSRMAQLVLSKGCPFACAFCEKAGLSISTMTAKQLRVTLQNFTDTGIERIIFWDEVFAWPHHEHGEQIGMLSEVGIGFNCNARLESLRPQVVERLANAGCKEILFGLEHIHEIEPELGRYLNLDRGKQRDLAFIADRIAMLKDHGIAPVGSLIVGLPGDTASAITQRVDIADSLGLSHCYVRPLVPFPESAIYRRLHDTGAIADFVDWDADQLSSFPHGYPTVSSVERTALAAHCGR